MRNTPHPVPHNADLPDGWAWWSGNRSDGYYTRNFGTKYAMGGKHAGEYGLGGFDGQVYCDEGGTDGHHVVIRPVEAIDEHGDPVYGYPAKSATFDTEREAVEAVPRLINEL